MPKLITWNIQSARTLGGGADVGQVVAALDRFSEFDVLCLQEIASGFASRDGGRCADQFAELARHLPGYTPAACVAVDTLAPDGSRQRLGSMVFSRFPVLQVLRHSLPWPSEPGVMSMLRCALELALQTPGGLLRILSCHLEYFSPLQRMAQVAQLRSLQRKAVLHALHPGPGKADAGAFAALPRPVPAVFAGDFNMLPDSSGHALMLAPFTDGTPSLRDAWRLVHPRRAHAPTVGLHDGNPGAAAPFTFDFAFVSSNLAPRVRRVSVDDSRTGPDHQALLLEFD